MYDLHNVERDIKHQLIIIIILQSRFSTAEGQEFISFEMADVMGDKIELTVTSNAGPDVEVAVSEIFAELCYTPKGMFQKTLNSRPSSGQPKSSLNRRAVSIMSSLLHVAKRPSVAQAEGLCEQALWYSTHNMKFNEKLTLHHEHHA